MLDTTLRNFYDRFNQRKTTLKMKRGTLLTDLEKDQIMAYNDANKSIRQRADAINRSKTVVANYLKNPEAYNAQKKGVDRENFRSEPHESYTESSRLAL